MQDRHEVVLEANITKFKQKMKEAENISKETGKKIAENTQFNVWKNGKMTLSNGVELVKKDASELNQTLNETSKTSNVVGNDINKAFSKGLKSVKRLTLGFLGARTAFSLFRKYMSEYQSQNEEFANKMQLTTNVITNALAPAFEFFGNVIQYAVIGLARIIELLTGVNILAKTVDNGFKGASKSAKEFNDNLSGLDEISNIQEDSGGLSTGIGSQLNALADFQKKMAEVDKWLEKSGLKKFFTDVKKIIGDLWNGFKNQPEWLKWLEAGIGIAGLLSLKLGGKLGLEGIIIAIAGLTIANLISEFDKLLKKIDEVQKYSDLVLKTSKFQEKKTKEVTEEITTGIQNGLYTTDELNRKFKVASGSISSSIDDMIRAEKAFKEESFGVKGIINNLFDTGVVENHVQSVKNSRTTLMMYLTTMKELYNQGNLDNKQQQEYVNSLEKTKNKMQEAGLTTGKYKDILKEIDTQLNSLKNKSVTATVKVEADMSKFRQALKRFEGVNLAGIGIGFQNLPSYDVGTAYVPRDQIAMIHEGERIIPKQYNNADYLGQLGNSETNMLLMELNRSILEFANRPQTLNVNGKELAKVTYGDFQEESSRRGTNTSIRRV